MFVYLKEKQKFYLQKSSVIFCCHLLVISMSCKRVNRGGGYGLEVPCNYCLTGQEKALEWGEIKLSVLEKCPLYPRKVPLYLQNLR